MPMLTMPEPVYVNQINLPKSMLTNYNIGILGTTGEGKTVYLSTLFFLLDKAAYANASIIEYDQVEYLIDNATAIGTKTWPEILNQIAGTEDTSKVVFTIQHRQKPYRLSFFDYKGESIYYNVNTPQALVDAFKKIDGLIITVSDRHYNANTESFNADWEASLRKLYKAIGPRPTVLVLTKGDQLIEARHIPSGQASTWLRERTTILRSKMQQMIGNLVGDFEVFVKSAKYVVDRLDNGPAAFRNNLVGDPADLAEPLFALLSMIDRHMVIDQRKLAEKAANEWKVAQANAFAKLTRMESHVETACETMNQNVKDIEALITQKIKHQVKVEPHRLKSNALAQSALDYVRGLSAKHQHITSATSVDMLNAILREAEGVLRRAEIDLNTSNEQLQLAQATPGRGWLDRMVYVSTWLLPFGPML